MGRTLAQALQAPIVTLAALALAGSCAAEERDVCKAKQVAYLSDTDPAYKYLEDRQRAIYEGFEDVNDPFSREALNRPQAIQSFKDLSDELAKLGCDAAGRGCVGDAKLYDDILERLGCTPLPTRFESPMFLIALEFIREDLEAVQDRDYPGTPRAHFGSLPGGAIDGETMLPKGAKQPIAILNRDVFYFTGAFSKAVSDAVPIGEARGMVTLSSDPAAIRARLAANPHIVRNFADAMTRLVRTGSSRGAEEVMLDANHARLHARLVSAMDSFIVGHEQAHAIRRHVGPGVPHRFQGVQFVAATADPAPGPVVDLVAHSRNQELEADELGFRLYVKARSRDADDAAAAMSLMVGSASANIVFRVLQVADDYRVALAGQAFHDADHPTAAQRQAAVDRVYAEVAQGGALAGIPDFRVVFGASLDELIVQADPIIRRDLGLPAKAARPH